ncbi:hypothetical protein ACHQM5_025030 [Ranunculus cassubicifolius]
MNAVSVAHKNSKKYSWNSVRDLMILSRLKLYCKGKPPQKIVECYWGLPPVGWAKINTDGASNGNPGPSGWGAVIRDDKGELLATGIGGLGIETSYVAECVAIVNGLMKAEEMGKKNIVGI